jgi:HSP20 family molecular chaperone IbpA
MTTPQTQATAAATPQVNVLLPRVDVSEDGEGLTLLADLPGVPKANLHLRVDGDTLTIDAEVALAAPDAAIASAAPARQSRFQRSFSLSRELDTTQVAAEFNLGVLRVRIPKTSHAQARKIDVQVH